MAGAALLAVALLAACCCAPLARASRALAQQPPRQPQQQRPPQQQQQQQQQQQAGTTAQQRAGKAKELHILHMNDVHNRIEETSAGSSTCQPLQAEAGTCLGGWARLAALAREARRNASDACAAFLLLDAGDQFDGSLWDVVYKGAATAVVQNLVKPDAMTLGNHEFSFPAKNLRAYINNLTFPMLGACNIDFSGEPLLQNRTVPPGAPPQPLVQRYVIKDAGGYKVALLGWITPDTAFGAANVGAVTFGDPIPSVKRCVADIKRAVPDVHMIIGMSHTGYDEDLQMAAAVPELDLIIGGHSHTFLWPNDAAPIFDKSNRKVTAKNCLDKHACDNIEGKYPTYVSSKLCGADGKCSQKVVPVVQAFYASKYVGSLKIDLATKKITDGRVILVGGNMSSNPVTPDPEVAAAIAKLAGPVERLGKQAAGFLNVTMVGGKVGRRVETNFGNFVTDLMVDTVAKLPLAKEHPTAIGFFNGGALRADIEPENGVSYGEILTALPFLNTLAVKEVTGEQLRNTVAYGLSGWNETEGRFLQVSGLRIWHRGNDLLDVQLLADNKTAPINPKGSYSVVTLDFIANGGDGFKDLKGAKALLANGDRIDELIFKAIKGLAPDPVVPPEPAVQRRIIDCAAKYVDCANAALFGPCCTKAPAADAPAAGAGRRLLAALLALLRP